MRFDRLDLNLLVAFDVLVELRSVSAAARRLNLSQPTISHSLGRLREFFEDELLILTGREMVPTPKALELAESVRQALTLIRTGITRPTKFDPQTARRNIVLVASDYAFDVVVSQAISEAATLAPNLTFHVMSPDMRKIERFLKAEIDLLIGVDGAFGFLDHPKIPLFADEEAIICWSGSRHAGGIDLGGFEAAGHVVAVFGDDCRPSSADLELQKREIQRKLEVKVPGFSALPRAVIGSERLAVMHRRHAEHFARHLPITVHKLPLELPGVVEIAQWHRSRIKDQALQWFLDLLAAQAANVDSDPRALPQVA